MRIQRAGSYVTKENAPAPGRGGQSNLLCLDAFWPLGSDQWPFFASTSLPIMEHIQKALGSRIRKLRTERGFSQMRFARRCGLHPSYMGEIERGETNLTLASLILITRRLRTTIAQLFDGIG
ncbi:MAG TPA: helix-turn-helix transcriptional regulator [Candidatus Angelobacter sp.]|nr:helix-turn-helix transcriptional regulator [Candidatus Angelobacter sp.]